MILLIRRKHISVLMILLLATVTVLSVAAENPAAAVIAHDAAGSGETVILDAGHGGSDGGAVAEDGTAESGINLAIVLRLREMFHFMGYRTVLTRSGNASLADPDSGTLRGEKVSDTKNRVELINCVQNGVLLSIHQNMLPGYPSVHGAQVFYGKIAGSAERAQMMQQTLNTAVNPNNEKVAKPIGSDIYIMAHSEHPALLVECGFLSNPEETRQLQTNDYQMKLAAAICCGYLQYQ